MEDALIWLTENTDEEDFAIILTDSYSFLRKLQSARIKKEWLRLLMAIKGVLNIVYVPGHAGIYYNEVADKLAGIAVPFGDIKLTVPDVVDIIQKNCLPEEKGIKRGEGGRVYLRGDSRRLMTQLKKGVITMNGLKTLLDMLEGGGPRWLPESLLL
ncbi:hypothetical protein Bbelb_115160 [Branchiostoma belcheri]|nr:hypothetical protein Bbelb_115160 [Branchiostoma belcheri]